MNWKNWNIQKKLVLMLSLAGFALCSVFLLYLSWKSQSQILADARSKGVEMVQRSAQMFMVSTAKYHDALAAAKTPQEKEAINKDWNRTIEAVDEAVIHDFGADQPRVRLIGDEAITQVKPVGKDSIKIKSSFEDKALRELMKGGNKYEETADGFYRVAFPLLNNMHAGCAECHGLKLDGRIVMGSVNAYVPLAGMQTVAADQTLTLSVFIVAGLTLLIAFIGIFLRRSMIKPVQSIIDYLGLASDQLSVSSAHITQSSQSLADNASKQAASLEETSASIEEMASMTHRNAKNAGSAKDAAIQSRKSAESGSETTKKMAQTMDNIKASGEAMRGAMNDVKSSNDDVAKIIKTIDEIAFQTNILALNAAVEAARAGESGMGFAVVADEVRNLAQKSAQAARDTAGKIEAAIQKSQRGVQMSDKVAENLASMVEEAKKMEHSLNEIVDKAKEVDGMVGEIATASHEQSQGIEQINKAVAEIDSVTQSTASTAEETASAAEEMRAQAQTLETAVRDLQNIIGGSHEEKKISKIDQASTPLIHTRSSTQKNQHPTAQVRKNSAAKLTLDAINSDTSRNALQLDGDFKDF